MDFAIKFVFVMASMMLADVCWTMYFIHIDKRNGVKAGLWGSSIILFGAFTTVSYVSDHRLLIAAIVGSFIGTLGTVEYKKMKEKQ